MPGGETIWTTGAALSATYDSTSHRPTATAEPIIVEGNYWAATYDAQTATITTAAGGGTPGAGDYRVSGAKVVNLNAQNSGADKIWPGITDLGSLNDASSTAAVYNTNLPKVSCLVEPTDPMTVLVIYVQYDQA